MNNDPKHYPGWTRVERIKGSDGEAFAVARFVIDRQKLNLGAYVVDGVTHYNDGNTLSTSAEVEDYKANMACTE